MDLASIVAQLRQERARLDQAIAALEGGQTARRPGRPPKSASAPKVAQRGPRHMSAAARAKISAAAKARWRKIKGQAGGKKSGTTPKKATRPGMSAAARKKLSTLMKARWAARKRAA